MQHGDGKITTSDIYNEKHLFGITVGIAFDVNMWRRVKAVAALFFGGESRLFTIYALDSNGKLLN